MTLFAVVVFACAASSPKPVLVTTAETSRYVRTGRYQEAVTLCHDFARAYDGVSCDEIGRTVEDRPIVALRIVRTPGAPTIYVQAGIHAGEIEGKDAGFAFLRDLLDGRVAPSALEAVSVVFVPVMNPDGHERFGPNHRPNQRGPEQMGFRTNAARLNLNRDFVKADAPETQAVLRLIANLDPVLMLDLHTTDGAKFEHDISINTAPIAARVDRLDEAGNELSAAVVKRLTELGHLPVEFYPAFRNDEDPLSGFERTEAPPRFAQFYIAARSRLGILVETHSWRTYRERAESTYHTLQAVFELATGQAQRWRAIELEATRADAKLAGSAVPMMWAAGPQSRPIAFRGYAYDKRISDLTGGTWLVYDETKPQVWTVPLFDQLVPAATITAPGAGYIVDGGYAPAVAAVLVRHGLTWQRIAEGKKLAIQTFRSTKVTFQPPYEGRTRAQIEGTWTAETRTLDRGAIFVPIAQPGARLILHLFEPSLPDSLAQWGLFNTAFERKEYMEPYVTEEAARQMLANDPSLRAAFEAAVASDPAMADSPALKLEWFYRRHPAWDERVNLLPVYRIAHPP
ncbi:MAG: M14 family zinc carboxypeptidase [Kofleriaceae bacterium]